MKAKLCCHDFADSSPLECHKESVYPVLVTLLGNTSCRLRCQGVQGLVLLVKVPALLSQEEVSQLTQHIINTRLTDQDKTVRYGNHCIVD